MALVTMEFKWDLEECRQIPMKEGRAEMLCNCLRVSGAASRSLAESCTNTKWRCGKHTKLT
ncbi:hypothetical protein ACRRTK_005725 [Alexandromys fortis]